jgi:hypothetical protein
MITTAHHQTLKYHSSIKPLLKYWAAGNTLILIFTLLFYKSGSLEDWALAMGIVNLLLLVARSMTTLLGSISIDEKDQTVEIELSRFIFKTTTIKCPVRDMNLELLSQRNVVTGQIIVFKLSHQSKVLVETVAGFSGWTAATLQEIAMRIEMLKQEQPQAVA